MQEKHIGVDYKALFVSVVIRHCLSRRKWDGCTLTPQYGGGNKTFNSHVRDVDMTSRSWRKEDMGWRHGGFPKFLARGEKRRLPDGSPFLSFIVQELVSRLLQLISERGQ